MLGQSWFTTRTHYLWRHAIRLSLTLPTTSLLFFTVRVKVECHLIRIFQLLFLLRFINKQAQLLEFSLVQLLLFLKVLDPRLDDVEDVLIVCQLTRLQNWIVQ